MIFVVAIISYLLGSIPAAFLIGMIFFKTDIRKMGSGNVGTTNAFRNFGKAAGLATFLIDFLKGSLAAYIGLKLSGTSGEAVALLFVVIGHMFSFLLKFKAGKGVATAFGSLLAIDYKFALFLLIVFLIVLFTTKIVSLSSITSAAAALIAGFIYFGFNIMSISTFLVASLVIIKHKKNIERLKKGQEKRII